MTFSEWFPTRNSLSPDKTGAFNNLNYLGVVVCLEIVGLLILISFIGHHVLFHFIGSSVSSSGKTLIPVLTF